MHNGMLKIGAEKMSKSLGNSLLIPDVTKKIRPVELRYYLAAPTTAPPSTTPRRRCSRPPRPTSASRASSPAPRR
nr:hypothetical protein GCM10020093_086470 [Planobispora longispora]